MGGKGRLVGSLSGGERQGGPGMGVKGRRRPRPRRGKARSRRARARGGRPSRRRPALPVLPGARQKCQKVKSQKSRVKKTSCPTDTGKLIQHGQYFSFIFYGPCPNRISLPDICFRQLDGNLTPSCCRCRCSTTSSRRRAARCDGSGKRGHRSTCRRSARSCPCPSER